MDKKAISPLIATLLLLSFAVALGVVIMNFGRAQVELEAQCPIDIGLRFAEIGEEQQICYDDAKKEVSFIVENGVNIKVSGMIVNTISSEKAETKELPEAKMAKAGSYMGHIPYDTAVNGEFRQMKITPKINLYDEEQICLEKSLVVEKLPSC